MAKSTGSFERADRGSITILAILWIGVLVIGLYALTTAGRSLILRQQLVTAFQSAALTLEFTMRDRGPTRSSADTFQRLAQENFGPCGSVVLSTFSVRRTSRNGWTVAAGGYAWISSLAVPDPTGRIMVAVRIGP